MKVIMSPQQEPSNIDDIGFISNFTRLDDTGDDRSTHHRVSFGTTTVREYERKLDRPNSDTALGLTIGWRYIQHEPVTVDIFKGEDEGFREAEMTSDEDRATILLENGYSKRELRAALKHQWELSGNNQSSVMLKPLRSVPTSLAKKILKGTKQFLLSSLLRTHW